MFTEKEILCKKLHNTVRNFLSQKDIFYHRQKFPFTWRNVLSLEWIVWHMNEYISCDKTKLSVTEQNYCHLSQDKISCEEKKLLVKGRNFLVQYKISWHMKKFPVTEQNILLQEEASPAYVPHLTVLYPHFYWGWQEAIHLGSDTTPFNVLIVQLGLGLSWTLK